jgi:hypothetical protein
MGKTRRTETKRVDVGQRICEKEECENERTKEKKKIVWLLLLALPLINVKTKAATF